MAIKTTYPYEATSPGVARHQCEECGKWERSDKGAILHSKSCESREQGAVALPDSASPTAAMRFKASLTSASELDRLARQVRRTGMAGGRHGDVREAVRAGYLSESDAMNLDD